MASDYWGYDNVMGVEFEDRDFHDNVEAYIKEKTKDGNLFFVDVVNSQSDEVFYVVLEEIYPHKVLEVNSLTPADFEGEDSILNDEDED